MRRQCGNEWGNDDAVTTTRQPAANYDQCRAQAISGSDPAMIQSAPDSSETDQTESTPRAERL
jgi:hypothetical protein